MTTFDAATTAAASSDATDAVFVNDVPSATEFCTATGTCMAGSVVSAATGYEPE